MVGSLSGDLGTIDGVRVVFFKGGKSYMPLGIVIRWLEQEAWHATAKKKMHYNKILERLRRFQAEPESVNGNQA